MCHWWLKEFEIFFFSWVYEEEADKPGFFCLQGMYINDVITEGRWQGGESYHKALATAKFCLNQRLNTNVNIISNLRFKLILPNVTYPYLPSCFYNLLISQTFLRFSCTKITSSWGGCKKIMTGEGLKWPKKVWVHLYP